MIDDSPQDQRVATGSDQADIILGGGFPINSINIIMGQPGTGKTVFAEHLAFHNAGDRPILYVTTLSEPVSKVVKYLQRFSFFDEDLIGTAVHYEDIGERLAASGIDALLAYVRGAIETLGPKIIVIDSYKALHDIAPSAADMRLMLYGLTSLLSAYAATVFLVGEYTDDHARVLPEFAVADGIIQLLRNPQSTRDERFLRVLKLRGSSYLEGLHGFTITPAGLDVYPRLVTPEVPTDYRQNDELIPSGVDGLDAVLGGGLGRGRSTLVAGPTGAGKTTLALRFALQALADGESALYVNFQENPTQLALTIRKLGVNQVESPTHRLQFLYVSPVELQIDSLIVTLFRRVQAENIRRVVIDAVGDLQMAASDHARLHDYLYALVQHFTIRGVTSVLTLETSGNPARGGFSDHNTRFSSMADNIVLLTLDTEHERKRSLTILKARGTDHDLGVHEMVVLADGVHVL